MDKNEEVEILNEIYDTDAFVIEESERPDFILDFHNRPDRYKFGVEVTQLFASESHARFYKLPGYFDQVMDTRRYNSPKDEKLFPVRRVTLISPEGERSEIDGIISYENPTERFLVLADEIQKKTAKAETYSRECIYHNLIIKDYEGAFSRPQDGKFSIPFELFENLKDSEFREIFLLTWIDGVKGYIPLKYLVFHVELNSVIEQIQQLTQIEKEELDSNFVQYFYSVLSSKKYRTLNVVKDGTSQALVYSRYALRRENGWMLRCINEGVHFPPPILEPIQDDYVTRFAERRIDSFGFPQNYFFKLPEGRISTLTDK